MHRAQEQVRDFHKACDLRAPNKVDIDWSELLNLRYDLIEEELGEFVRAAVHKSPTDTIGELCDVLYQVYGAAVSMGIDLEPFFDAIHEANMNKAGGPKRGDGKQLKPEEWVSADLRPLWNEALEET
jgi:predicted HAD superfamily Cof-like phosphohydrolase